MIAIKKPLIALLALVVLSAGATLAQAQRQVYRGTRASVQQLILRIENRTDVFRNTVNAQNQTQIYSAENLNVLSQDLDTAVAQLLQSVDGRQSTTADAQEVLNRAALIDRVLTGRNVRNTTVLRSWTNLRASLNQLATAYYLTWPTVGQTYPPNGYPNPGPVYGANRLTGTYQLNVS